MKHYQIQVRVTAPSDRLPSPYEVLQPLAEKIAEQLRDREWGGGGGMYYQNTYNLNFYAPESHLDDALGLIQDAITEQPYTAHDPEVEEIPKGTLFQMVIRNKWLCADCETIAEFVQRYRDQAVMIEEWQENGIWLDPGSDIESDYAVFVTDNPEVGLRFNFNREQLEEEE